MTVYCPFMSGPVTVQTPQGPVYKTHHAECMAGKCAMWRSTGKSDWVPRGYIESGGVCWLKEAAQALIENRDRNRREEAFGEGSRYD
jgi:hypothetical protein